MTTPLGFCGCGDFGVRDVTIKVVGGDIDIVHVQCGGAILVDDTVLMSVDMPATLTYTVSVDGEEAYQVLSPAGPESAE